MNKDIFAKRIDKELEILDNSNLDLRIRKISKGEYKVFISFDGCSINPILDGEIEFEIHFGQLYPYKAPNVYCKTPFCKPHIADGRDLVDDILEVNWIPSFKLIDIVSKVPSFLNEYIKSLQEGFLIMIGSFGLGEKYKKDFIDSLPVYTSKVLECEIIEGKPITLERTFLLSDIHICLFEKDKFPFVGDNFYLTFWTNLRSLVQLKKNGHNLKLFFKQHHTKKLLEMTLIMPNATLVFKRIVKLIKSLGISSKQINAKPKTGKLPQIDINNVEKEILELGQKVLDKPIKEEVYRVMDLHQQAIEYYSATNDEKYGIYLDKLHTFLNHPVIKSFLDVNDPQKESVASSKQKLKYDDKIGNPSTRQISEMILKQGRNENIELKLRENKFENDSHTEIVETITKKMLHKDGESEEY